MIQIAGANVSASLTAVEQTVLLIDDDPFVLQTMQAALECPNCEVYIAFDGREGLRIARSRKLDVVVLDVCMPRLDGFGVLEKLRERSKERLKVIMITGDEKPGHRKYADIVGANVFLTKPFNMSVLIDHVRN